MLADAPSLPEGLEYLWADFLHLHARRGSDGMVPSRITDLQIDAWQRVRGITLDSWELDAIDRADAAFFAAKPKTPPQ